MQILAIRRNNYLLDNSSLLSAHWSHFLPELRQFLLDRQLLHCVNESKRNGPLKYPNNDWSQSFFVAIRLI